MAETWGRRTQGVCRRLYPLVALKHRFGLVVRALLPLGVDPPQVVLQPLALLAIGRIDQPVAELVLLVPQMLAVFPIRLFLAVTRRRITRGRVTRPRRILRLPGRWTRSGCLAAIADQISVVVADIADAVRDIESGQLLAAPIRSAAERGQRGPLHSDVSAALPIRARRRSLRIHRRGCEGEYEPRKQPDNDLHLFLTRFENAITVEMSGKFLDNPVGLQASQRLRRR